MPSLASTTSSAASASAAPLTMLARNSRWPGASITTMSRSGSRSQTRVVSMVTAWSRSAWKASRTKDHSMATPRRSLTARSSSALPVGSAPSSWSSRPISVDLPWSTWPTTTSRSGAEVMDRVRSHVSLRAQALEGVLALVVHRAARALGLAARLQLQDDLGDGGGVRRHREGDILLAQRSEAATVAREIKGHHRHALSLDITPNVDLRPAEERVHAHVAARRRLRVEAVPELRRLVPEVPAARGIAWAKDSFLAADRLLVAADAEDHAAEAALGDDALETEGLARGGARLGRQRGIGLLGAGAGRIDIGKAPLADDPVAERIDLGELVAGVEQDDRKGHAAEERLAREPEQRVRVLADRPEHADRLQTVHRLAQDEDR